MVFSKCPGHTKRYMKNSRIMMASIVAAAVFSIAAAPIAPNAFAADPLGSNGVNWGAATAFFAQIEPGNQGEHASDQEEPRTGLGNLKQAFDGDWCGVLEFLNDFDDEAVLTCAEQEE